VGRVTFFAVIGLTASLCDTPSCGCKVFFAFLGMAFGSVLFIQIASAFFRVPRLASK